MADFNGVLQAGAYAGFNAVYGTGRVIESVCWTHARRKVYDLPAVSPTLLTTETLCLIGELHFIEESILGRPPDECRGARQLQAKPLLDGLKLWLHSTLAKLFRKFDTAAAIQYALKLWPALSRYTDDGRIEIDSSPPNAHYVASH